MENVRKHIDVQLVTANRKGYYLVSEPSYHITKEFFKKFTSSRNKKIKVKMNKSVYLSLSILVISKTLIYEFWHDYIKPKYQYKAKLCYMDTESFTIYIKTEDIYEDIANDDEKRFDTSNYAIKRPLPRGKNKKVIGIIKDELGEKIMTELVGLRPKTYAYLDKVKEQKKQSNKGKRTKRMCNTKNTQV